MCNRYTIASNSNALEQELQAEFQFTFQKTYNAHFGMELPVIVAGEESKIVSYQWGLVPFWSRGSSPTYHHINSPARYIVKNPVFRVPIRRRRCLVPANSFFIWVLNSAGKKEPYVVYDSRQRIMTFAGIWDEWTNEEGSKCIRSFSIVTTPGSGRLKKFTQQIPVIIPPGRRRKYLRFSTSLQEVVRLLRPQESDSINLFPVSTRVNDFRINTKDVLAPVGQRVFKEFTYVPKVYLKLEGMGSMKDNPDRKPEFKLMLE